MNNKIDSNDGKTHRPTVSTPVVKLTFSSMVSWLTNAFALAAAFAQPPSPEIGSVDHGNRRRSFNSKPQKMLTRRGKC